MTQSTSSLSPTKRKIVLVLLCGLPACGKTTLAQQFIQQQHEGTSNSFETQHVCFDEIFFEQQQNDSNGNLEQQQFDADEWKKSQAVAFASVESVIAAAASLENDRPLVILVDDNNYYKSMRHRYVRLARRNELFCCVFALRAPASLCKQRNAQRQGNHRVPDIVIEDMSRRIEYPQIDDEVDHIPFEVVSVGVGLGLLSLEQMMEQLQQLIICCLSDPRGPLSDLKLREEEERLEQERQKSRQALMASVSHHADIALRQAVSAAMQRLVLDASYTKEQSKQMKSIVSQKLNELRKVVIEQLKQEVAAEQGNGRSIDDWKKHAVEIFDNGALGILQQQGYDGQCNLGI